MSAIQKKVLILALVLVAMVVMFEMASAQYGGYGGRGFGRGNYGGGRYYGGRGFGGGRGYGGGFGRGGYGRGYRGGYDSYDSYSSGDHSYGNSFDSDDSYMDVYATSPSSFKQTSSVSLSGRSISPNSLASSDELPFAGRTDQKFGSVPQMSWTFSQNQQPSGSFDGNEQIFGLNTSEDRSFMGDSIGRGGATERTREKSMLAPARQASSAPLNTRPTNLPTIATPIVPSSTTTGAPEYVMINPTRDTNDSGNSSDQDE